MPPPPAAPSPKARPPLRRQRQPRRHKGHKGATRALCVVLCALRVFVADVAFGTGGSRTGILRGGAGRVPCIACVFGIVLLEWRSPPRARAASPGARVG